MLEVVIKYNPYKVISEITVNGETPKDNSKIKQYLNQRFQMWVDLLPALLAEEYNDDEMAVTFYGTELDYQDLYAALKAEEKKNGIQFKVDKRPAKEFGDKENDIRNLFKKVQELPFEELQSPAVVNAFELAFNELLEVNVVATMSAGKSTLINALLGKKLIRMYVTKYCRPAKITNVVNTFIHKLDDAEAFEKTKKEIASRKDEQIELEKVINILTEKLTSQVENNAFKEKIENLNIESELEEKLDTLIMDTESPITLCFDGCPKEMEEYAAKNFIQGFETLVTQKQNEFQVKVDYLLLEDIQVKGQRLLDEYIQKLIAISDECGLKGIHIDLSSFVRGKLASLNTNAALVNSVDSRIETHTEERSRTITKRRRGLDRLLHPLNWFDPEYQVIEYYDVDVEEEIRYINSEKLRLQLFAPVRKSLLEERSRILQFAKGETENIKNYFYSQFAEVDAFLIKKTNELNNVVHSQKASEEALEEAKCLLEKLEAIKRELELILDI